MASPLASVPLVTKTGAKAAADALSGKVVALYFSAHWCPPCRGFTPVLKSFYEQLKGNGKNIEIIFVSGDKSEQEFQDYFRNEHGDWLAVDFSAKERKTLNEHYKVQGIPTLIVVDGSGKNVVPDARSDVAGAENPATVQGVFDEWKKSAGDWRETAGTALGGGSGAAAPKTPAELRAARLAALDARLGGGGAGGGAAQAPATTGATQTEGAATLQAAPPQPAPAPVATPPPAAPAASPPPAASAMDAGKVAQITGMGFTDEQARGALTSTSGDVEQALNLLLA